MAVERTGRSERPASEQRPWAELGDSGLLWLINRSVLHPRGFSLAMAEDGSGWQLLGDGTEVWMFLGAEDEDACFANLEAFLDAHRPQRVP